MQHKQSFIVSMLSSTLLMGSMTSASSQDLFNIRLNGYQEVPAISTFGRGSFSLSDILVYRLVYELEGDITQAHIHFGQAGVNGGVMIWLCANDGVPAPTDTPFCEGSDGFVSGALTSETVIGPGVQGIEPGEGGAALDAIINGTTYVNVHSTAYPAGEIRGQLKFDSADGSLRELREELEDLRDDLEDLEDDFDGHTHTYLTGRGTGHNNTEATSGPPEF